MALLTFLAELGRERGFSVAAAHFNHGLRPEAGADETFVRDWTAERGIPFAVGRGDAAAYSRERGLSPEEGARQLRYAFLDRAREEQGAWALATAHHLDDQAETVLLNLTRGTGLWGLRGIAPWQGRRMRPLLTTPRSEIQAYVEENGIPFVEDESNQDLRCPRNRIRHCVLPQLREINPKAAEALSRAAAAAGEETAYLEDQVREAPLVSLPYGAGIDFRKFLDLPEPVRQALLRRLLRETGAGAKDLSALQLTAAARLSPGGALTLPGGVFLSVEAGLLRAERPPQAPPPVPLPWEGQAVWGDWRLSCRTVRGPAASDRCTLVFPRRTLRGDLTVGAWRPGDRMEAARGSRSVKRLFQDAGIPVSRRGLTPVLYCGGTPVGFFPVPESLRRETGEEETLAVHACRQEREAVT